MVEAAWSQEAMATFQVEMLARDWVGQRMQWYEQMPWRLVEINMVKEVAGDLREGIEELGLAATQALGTKLRWKEDEFSILGSSC